MNAAQSKLIIREAEMNEFRRAFGDGNTFEQACSRACIYQGTAGYKIALDLWTKWHRQMRGDHS